VREGTQQSHPEATTGISSKAGFSGLQGKERGLGDGGKDQITLSQKIGIGSRHVRSMSGHGKKSVIRIPEGKSGSQEKRTVEREGETDRSPLNRKKKAPQDDQLKKKRESPMLGDKKGPEKTGRGERAHRLPGCKSCGHELPAHQIL